MVASDGKALQVLSAHWPAQDGDALVSPIKAMNEASRVVSQSRVSQITQGKVRVENLDSETAMALTIFGIWELAEVAWAAEARDPQRKKQARAVLYGLGR